MLDQKLALANQKASNFVLNNEILVPTIRQINELLRSATGSGELFSAFRMSDVNSIGVISKDDFINVVFDNVKHVKPADLMTKILTVKEIDDRLRRMSIYMKVSGERKQMASVEKSEMRRVGPTPISPFGAGQGENNISECQLDDRPTSNFTLWRGAV